MPAMGIGLMAVNTFDGNHLAIDQQLAPFYLNVSKSDLFLYVLVVAGIVRI